MQLTPRAPARINFFLGRQSLIQVFSIVEANTALRYVALDSIEGDSGTEFPTILAIPNVGVSATGIMDQRYAIVPRDCKLQFTVSVTADRRKRRSVYQAYNPDAVDASFGGLYRAEAFIAGWVTSWHEPTEWARSTMIAINTAMRSVAQRKKAYWIDAEALSCMQDGMRLTTNIRIAKEYDLRL
jgi:hypothetical protein